jgi:hypothetical protein
MDELPSLPSPPPPASTAGWLLLDVGHRAATPVLRLATDTPSSWFHWLRGTAPAARPGGAPGARSHLAGQPVSRWCALILQFGSRCVARYGIRAQMTPERTAPIARRPKVWTDLPSRGSQPLGGLPAHAPTPTPTHDTTTARGPTPATRRHTSVLRRPPSSRGPHHHPRPPRSRVRSPACACALREPPRTRAAWWLREARRMRSYSTAAAACQKVSPSDLTHLTHYTLCWLGWGNCHQVHHHQLPPRARARSLRREGYSRATRA